MIIYRPVILTHVRATAGLDKLDVSYNAPKPRYKSLIAPSVVNVSKLSGS